MNGIMANWMNKINLKPFMDAYEKEEITIQELGKKVSKFLNDFEIKPKSYKDELEEIADNFETVESEDEFNNYLNDLYDFGDIEIGQSQGIIRKRIAWIETRM